MKSKNQSQIRENKSVRPFAFKFAGGCLLLFSFAIQNFQYNTWNDEENSFQQWRRLEADTYEKATLYEILYFAAKDDQNNSYELVRQANIRKAAEFQAQASYFSTDPSIDSAGLRAYLGEKSVAPPDSQQVIARVHDYASYLTARREFQEHVMENHRQGLVTTIGFHNRKVLAGYAYLGLYILGSVLVLFGSIIEYRICES